MPRAFGRHARLLWSPGAGGESFRVSGTRMLDCIAVEDEWSIGMIEVTPLGESDQEYSSVSRGGRVLLRFDVRPGTIPQIPTHVPATLRVYDSVHYGRYREGSVILERMAWRARQQAGEPQHLWYAGRWTGGHTEVVEAPPSLSGATWNGGTKTLTMTFSRDIQRGETPLSGGIRFIASDGTRFNVAVEPTITGAVATVSGDLSFSVDDGTFSPANSITIASGFFVSSDFPDDPAMVQAAITDAPLS